MTPQELIDFKTRCNSAVTYGRTIANAEAYAAELEAEAGPVELDPGTEKHSAAHLVALVGKVEAVRAGAEKKGKAPAATAKAKEPDPEPVTVVEPAKEAKKKSKKAKKSDSDDEAGGEDDADESDDA